MSDIEDMKKEFKFLLNSHHELIKAMKKNNDGLMEMNILMRGLISLLRDYNEQS